jgi:DNA-binding transcriptional LysR family regulator
MWSALVAAPSNIKLGAVDLNLLVVFDAVMQERSVTRAGERVGLSQPAMSHALTRLRHMLKDDLFIRSPNGMVPTPRAEQLAVPIKLALEGLQESLEPPRFDPATATRHFRVAVDNYAAIVLVGPLATRFAKIAPRVVLEFQPSGRVEIPGALDRGEIELAIGPFTRQGERFSHQLLLRDEFVAVLRKNHPATSAGKLTIEAFAALQHLDISSVEHATDFVDAELARRKLSRRIALRAPFLSAVRILCASDMVSVFPKRIAEELVRYRPLAIHPLGQSSPKIETAMIWPRRLDNQVPHRWLRGMVSEICKTTPRSQ